MGKLILTSGGYIDGQRGERCDAIIESFSKNKSVLIVDNATTTGSNVKGLPILRSNFSKIAKSVEQLTLTADNLDKINNYDVLYVTGGDLGPFIELIATSDLRNAFLRYLERGGVIIGESAGSMIFGCDLKWAYDIKKGTKPKYDIVMPTHKGLGIVDINIFPHWNKASIDMQEKVAQYEEQNGIKVTRLCDGEFIERDYEKIK